MKTRLAQMKEHFAVGGTWICQSGRHIVTSAAGLQENSIYSIRCRECHKATQQVINRNVSYNRKFANGIVPYEPPSVCELCGSTSKNMQRDHDHATNIFRGWLCCHCNITMAIVDKVGLDKIAVFLRKGNK